LLYNVGDLVWMDEDEYVHAHTTYLKGLHYPKPMISELGLVIETKEEQWLMKISWVETSAKSWHGMDDHWISLVNRP